MIHNANLQLSNGKNALGSLVYIGDEKTKQLCEDYFINTMK